MEGTNTEERSPCLENTIISTLPREVWLICFEYLPLKDIRPCLFVSKSFSSLATSPILWENRLRRDYGELTAEERKEEEARPIRRTPLQLYFAIKESRLHTGWYQYIIQLEAQCHKALIFGKDNGIVWACSKGFNPTSREILVLCTSMKDDPSAQQLRATGLNMAGQKYIVVRAEPDFVAGMKGSGGIFCVRTNLAIIVGTYNEQFIPGQTQNALNKMADYLRGCGY